MVGFRSFGRGSGVLNPADKKSDKKFLNLLKVWEVCIGDLGIILFKINSFFVSFSTYIEHAYPTYAFYAYM